MILSPTMQRNLLIGGGVLALAYLIFNSNSAQTVANTVGSDVGNAVSAGIDVYFGIGVGLVLIALF